MIILNDITINDKTLFDQKINYKFDNSEATFANLFMWRKSSKTKYTIINDSLVIFYKKSDGRKACCFPFGCDDTKEIIDKIKEYFDTQNVDFIMESVTEDKANKLLNIYGNKITVIPEPNLFDYVYYSEKLIKLAGKKLHSKRNHINKFKSLYNYKYEKITSDTALECLKKADEWLISKYIDENDNDYISEITALKEVFNNYDKLNLAGGLIRVEGEIIAFSVGEKLNVNTFVTHIEKADTAYQGAYTVINNEFAKNECLSFKYINREEDMGIEGIRKAKLSYYPDKMIKKYMIQFKEK